jgi:glycosyltransferase involved in cell wall biosynthesis
MAQKNNKIAIITIAPGGGWNTVRKRWEKHFSTMKEPEFRFYHIEDYAQLIHRFTVQKHRLRSVWYLIAGRAAARQAIKDGCRTILIDTYHYAMWVPLVKNVKYFVYADATARQFTQLQPMMTNRWSSQGKLPPFIDWIYEKGTRRLAGYGGIFLGMNSWYLKALANEFGVPPEQLIELPFGLDVNLWKRKEITVNKPAEKGINILFVGDPFVGKGGEILRQIAAEPEFSECVFHFAGRTVDFEDEANCRFYNSLKAESEELLNLFSSCDLFVLPTYADCSPNVAVEALAMGLPVIITDIGATSDIVKDNETGRVVPYPPTKEKFRDKILEYMNNPELLKHESAAARKRAVEHFDINNHIRRLQDLLLAE